jgi:small multidrug resistance pump
MSAWLYLATAILFEVAGTLSMRLSEGFTKPLPSTLVFVCYAVSFIAMTFAIKRIDMSVTYAIWSATGTALIATIGIAYFDEPLTALKIFSLLLIILGVIGLNLGPTEH